MDKTTFGNLEMIKNLDTNKIFNVNDFIFRGMSS